MRKFVCIGLDCADPNLVFKEFLGFLPNISKLMKKGSFSSLESTIPPITVPAWMSMLTGKDPGELGLYGFQNRLDRSYKNILIPNATMVPYDTIWQTLSKMGFNSLIIGVPLTYPPKPFKVNIITSFLTPSVKSNYTFPKSLKYEITSWVDQYLFDVENLRTVDKKSVLRDVYKMTKNRFEIAYKLLRNKVWDFFMMVEMGTDRMHHAFWAHHDPTHSKHDPNSPFIDSIFKYYRYIDKKIGELLDILPKDVQVLIVSDHGVQKMKGGIAINDWLINHGLLSLKKRPKTITRIEKMIAEEMIDWKKTSCWAFGGYYGKMFINLKGREPTGLIHPASLNTFKNELEKNIFDIKDENGKVMNTKIYRPELIYKKLRNIPPDLMIYFGNLSWRAIGTVGNDSIWIHENDTGPDDANHAQQGIAISSGEYCPKKITQVYDYILNHFINAQ